MVDNRTKGGYRMGNHEKRVYLEAIRKRYSRSGRGYKGKILDEFCSVCSYQRKYAIRLLGSKPGKVTTASLDVLRIQPIRIVHGVTQNMGLQPSRCAASDWWLPCCFGCHTMRCLVRLFCRCLCEMWLLSKGARFYE